MMIWNCLFSESTVEKEGKKTLAKMHWSNMVSYFTSPSSYFLVISSPYPTSSTKGITDINIDEINQLTLEQQPYHTTKT